MKSIPLNMGTLDNIWWTDTHPNHSYTEYIHTHKGCTQPLCWTRKAVQCEVCVPSSWITILFPYEVSRCILIALSLWNVNGHFHIRNWTFQLLMVYEMPSFIQCAAFFLWQHQFHGYRSHWPVPLRLCCTDRPTSSPEQTTFNISLSLYHFSSHQAS